MVDDSSLVGYCGLFCGACAIYQQMIRKRGIQLLEVLDAYQLQRASMVQNSRAYA